MAAKRFCNNQTTQNAVFLGRAVEEEKIAVLAALGIKSALLFRSVSHFHSLFLSIALISTPCRYATLYCSKLFRFTFAWGFKNRSCNLKEKLSMGKEPVLTMEMTKVHDSYSMSHIALI